VGGAGVPKSKAGISELSGLIEAKSSPGYNTYNTYNNARKFTSKSAMPEKHRSLDVDRPTFVKSFIKGPPGYPVLSRDDPKTNTSTTNTTTSTSSDEDDYDDLGSANDVVVVVNDDSDSRSSLPKLPSLRDHSTKYSQELLTKIIEKAKKKHAAQIYDEENPPPSSSSSSTSSSKPTPARTTAPSSTRRGPTLSSSVGSPTSYLVEVYESESENTPPVVSKIPKT